MERNKNFRSDRFSHKHFSEHKKVFPFSFSFFPTAMFILVRLLERNEKKITIVVALGQQINFHLWNFTLRATAYLNV